MPRSRGPLFPELGFLPRRRRRYAARSNRPLLPQSAYPAFFNRFSFPRHLLPPPRDSVRDERRRVRNFLRKKKRKKFPRRTRRRDNRDPRDEKKIVRRKMVSVDSLRGSFAVTKTKNAALATPHRKKTCALLPCSSTCMFCVYV